ncbi:hypothetical protein P4V00_23560 [Brevibacillus agri]|uniref:hypothetical protein n=1 Tax=Brevibacillus agri TaxID=51101 RepID=UPI002E22A2FD|nr:hypothetical protein [Brevibacillus agri]MED1657699.1 hypothetical protein [Brevibacillus agri]MED1689500.1 hypothetical protein [Brevibacillus agri]MED1694455.1 hypothetical protein [Brevibacillus agri]
MDKNQKMQQHALPLLKIDWVSQSENNVTGNHINGFNQKQEHIFGYQRTKKTGYIDKQIGLNGSKGTKTPWNLK